MRISSWIETAIIIVLVVIFGWASEQRNSLWKDKILFWSDVVEKSPGKARPFNYLGLTYHRKGFEDKAISSFKRSISLDPYYANAYVNLGVSYFETGLTDRAIAQFKHAIQIKPNHADAHYNLGIAYGEKGMMEEAYSEMRKGMKLQKR
jgi:superkiller protein 3